MKSDKPPRTSADGIARMPRVVREEVSRALLERKTWRTVAKICADAGFPGVRAQNVSKYRHGRTHKEWLAREERLEAIRRDSENTAAIVRHYTENGGSPAEAGLLAAAEMMAAAVSGMGPDAVAEMVAADPKSIFGVVRELSRVADMLAKARSAAKPEEAPQAQTTAAERAARIREIFGL